MKNLFDKHRRLVQLVPTKIIRACSKTINWDVPMLSIRGPKGVGKSTIMLQYIRTHYALSDRSVLYCTCDGAYFSSHTLLDLADYFYKHGGRHLFLDEIHKYDNWSSEVKEIYDSYPNLRVVISGSSLLKLMEADADLSRRCVHHDIQGLSFREFLAFYKGVNIPVYSLENIISNPWQLCEQVMEQCCPLACFNEYLEYGYYPYYLKLKNRIDYYTTIEQVVQYVINEELPRICKVELGNTRKLGALMNVLSTSEPYEIDVKKMSMQSGLQRSTVVEYLLHLGNAKLLNLLYADVLNIKKLQKPDKIYLENPNMLYALSTAPVRIGTVRETFAVNQLSFVGTVEFGKQQGDFHFNQKYIFEVGGASKDYGQIAGIENSYILADDIEYPDGHKLPLWVIGFMY